MMLVPNPGVLDRLIRERHERLGPNRFQRLIDGRRAGVRVRLGHALIAVGARVSGERVELPAHRVRRHPRTA